MSPAETMTQKHPWYRRASKGLGLTLSMIKFSHTIFALPFGFLAAFVAARTLNQTHPSWPVLGWILAAMVGARTAAMTFNRLVDRDIDQRNPRTASRPLVSGQLRAGYAWTVFLAASLLFFFSAFQLNPLALKLSPLVFLILLGYSATKRFTWTAHFILGLSLALAPLGAWVAVLGEMNWQPLVLAGAVLTWVAGFDLIYACQDAEVDRDLGLFSIPSRFGVSKALLLSSALHLVTVALLVLYAWVSPLGWIYLGGVAAAALLLVFEHSLVKPDDLSRVNAAFFTLNGWVGVMLLAATLIDLYFEVGGPIDFVF